MLLSSFLFCDEVIVLKNWLPFRSVNENIMLLFWRVEMAIVDFCFTNDIKGVVHRCENLDE